MVFEQLNQQLFSLSNLISKLTNQQYSTKISHLGNISIGEHTRHMIELLNCAINAYTTDTVDYVNRSRDLSLESEREFALTTIEKIKEIVVQSDKKLNLYIENAEERTNDGVVTTYYREIVYNTEHVIHHLALIKVALFELNLKLVDDNFGMAYSTLKYKSLLEQEVSN